MERLSSLSQLPTTVLSSGYDRQKLRPGIVHIGLGAFHRAHQAVFTDRALETEFGPWGIVAVNLRSPEPVHYLEAQNGLYSVITRGENGDRVEVVGATVDWLCAAENQADVLAYLANPDIRIVTLTVTEKAYGLDPASGGLDLEHPSIAADIENPHAPTGPVGFLVEGLALRREKGIAPFTVLCCDNLPSNGHVVRRLVIEMAQRRDPELADWISSRGAFPCSMVDRIVPAATDDTRARAAGLLGVGDRLAVETEPFLQWVIEDNFVSGRPAWELGGAIFVEDVEPYEKMKLRLLNGSHTLIAHLGVLFDLEFVRDVMAVPAHVQRVREHMAAAAATLDPVPGVDLDVYMDQLVSRFRNPAIAHRTRQIAMDSSQKLPQRILAPAVEALASGGDDKVFAHAVAVWIAAVVTKQDISDPRRDDILHAATTLDASDPSASFFAIPGLFPSKLLDSRHWRDLVNAELRGITGG